MKFRLIAPCVLILAAVTGLAAPSAQKVPPVPSASNILSLVKKEHPRLLVTQADFSRMREGVNSDPTLKKWHADLARQAERILQQAPSRYEIPDGLRLLETSRRVLRRVQTLALLYRLHGKAEYAQRAWTELSAAAAFKDWNPRHFLDTAEMTHAFAIGYDWLFEVWTAEQRTQLRQAMLEKGIKPANDIQSRDTWWARARHNWNQVCNGGIGLGALALADEEPEACGRFLEAAIRSIRLPMAEFAPDGAWAEGPGYWDYATAYNVLFLAGLESALGTDFGLSQAPGFSQTGLFPIFASGPSGRSFDYADAHAGVIRAPQMFWLAHKFDLPVCAAYARQVASPHPLDLVWYEPGAGTPSPAVLPLDKHFRSSEVAMLRSAWDTPEAIWVGFKAGDNQANHSHLDLGSFVLEALGQRFAVELGADDYNLPGYFGRERWNYYRLRAEGHNTIVLNPGKAADQNPKAVAKITRFESAPKRAFAIANLTSASKNQATRAERGLALIDRRQVLVQDEIETAAPAEVWWFLHTRAEVTLEKEARAATLALSGKELEVRILSPQTARFTVMGATPLPSSPAPEKQSPNQGVRKLAIQLQAVQDLRLVVLLTPRLEGAQTGAPPPPVKPLAQW